MDSILPIKKITLAEMEERPLKKLCYNCDQWYVRGHKCKTRKLYLLERADDDEGLDLEEEEEDPTHKEKFDEPLISVHALVGLTSYQTIRVKGHIKRRSVTILIDSRSTYNFLNLDTAKQTRCLIHKTNPLLVAVVDGSKISSSNICRQLQWFMQGTVVHTNMRLLPLSGCEMVLSVQWLATLGPIV